MQHKLTTQHISSILFATDPMRTCCRENDCFDEYNYISSRVSQLLVDGYSIPNALKAALHESFGFELTENCDLTNALSRLEEI